jgi:IS5 family transposase
MRKRFEQQLSIGIIPISEVKIKYSNRDSIRPFLAALQQIYITSEYNEKIFSILEDKLIKGKKRTGRPGMDLWQIFVLAQFRLCWNISYDRLHELANEHKTLRQIMGVEKGFGHEPIEIGYQNIIDNLSLLDDETVKELNNVIVEFGHDVFKKKEAAALRLKTDSFVVESNVHFPTDYNLLWDSARKSLDMVDKVQSKYKLEGWRKIRDWRKGLKNKMRSLGRASVSGGKGKDQRVKATTKRYLAKSNALLNKLNSTKDTIPHEDIADMVIIMELDRFMELLSKHIDLLERRVIKGEEIPHQEKMFSIFEEYTEWITKGKMRPNVELGKKVAITTDQFHLIVDYWVMDHQSDSEIVKPLSDKIFEQYSIKSWSFDKGFWHKENKEYLSPKVEKLVMPKKGKCNNEEKVEESHPLFKKLKNKHSAVESNINELECHGLDRCPDKGYRNFKRYIGLAVCAYNLRRVGQELLSKRKAREKQQKQAA